jgi:hypothetical protein
MKTLLLILCFFNPSKLPFVGYQQVTFTRDFNGFWVTDKGFLSANINVWIIVRNNKAGYCTFMQPVDANIKRVTVLGVFPKAGFKMSQNLCIYIIKKYSQGTCWYIYDNSGLLLYRGDR